MAKYYVQSGTVKMVVAADDCEKAALWVVHRAMGQIVPVYDDIDLTPEEKGDVAVFRGIMVLGNTFRLSEVGFDRDDAVTLDTFDLIVQWHQLMIALDRLEKLMESGSVPSPKVVSGRQTQATQAMQTSDCLQNRLDA